MSDFRNKPPPPTAGPLQRLDGVIRPAGYVFYGWWIVLASAGIQMLGALFSAHSFAVYVVELKAEFGWSNTVLSFAFAMMRLESGILGPLQGWLADRFGPRIVLIVGTLLLGGGLMLFSYTWSIPSYYGSVLLIALGASLGGFATLMVALVSWFNRHRSKAIAGSQLGYAVGGLGLPLMALSIENFGWRPTAFATGLIVLAVCLPLSMLVRHRPEDIGEQMDGAPPPSQGAGSEGGAAQSPIDFTAKQAIRTSAFWLLSLGHAFALLAVSAVMLHAIPHLTTGMNYSLVEAAWFMTIVMGCQIIGQVLGGYLGDRFDKRWISIACMAGHSSALLLLAYAANTTMLVASAVIHGIAWGARGPLMVALRADYFGTRAFGMIMGISSMVIMFGMMGGPIVGGVLSDYYGNYVNAFAILGLVSLLGAICFYFATPPTRPHDQM